MPEEGLIKIILDFFGSVALIGSIVAAPHIGNYLSEKRLEAYIGCMNTVGIHSTYVPEGNSTGGYAEPVNNVNN